MKKIEEIESQIKDLLKEVEKLKQVPTQEPKFEVGKWYKSGKTLFNYQLDYGVYGFDDKGEWETCDSWIWETWFDGTRLATPQEVETALIAEAKKRGFKAGTRIKTEEFGESVISNSCAGFSYRDEKHHNYGSLYYNGKLIYTQGQWAEIIQDDKIMIGGYEVFFLTRNYNSGTGIERYTTIDGYPFEESFWEAARLISGHSKAKIMVGCSKQFDVSLETINKILAKL
jgi:hypothetical protein